MQIAPINFTNKGYSSSININTGEKNCASKTNFEGKLLNPDAAKTLIDKIAALQKALELKQSMQSRLTKELKQAQSDIEKLTSLLKKDTEDLKIALGGKGTKITTKLF